MQKDLPFVKMKQMCCCLLVCHFIPKELSLCCLNSAMAQCTFLTLVHIFRVLHSQNRSLVKIITDTARKKKYNEPELTELIISLCCSEISLYQRLWITAERNKTKRYFSVLKSLFYFYILKFYVRAYSEF